MLGGVRDHLVEIAMFGLERGEFRPQLLDIEVHKGCPEVAR
jgi:hypothetical protein